MPTSTTLLILTHKYRLLYARTRKLVSAGKTVAQARWRRLQRYERRLRRAGVAVAALTTLLGSGATLHAQPQPLGGETLVNTYTTARQRLPVTAADDSGNYVVVWESENQDGDGFGIFAQRFMANGMPAGGEFQVNVYTTSIQRDAAVAMDADGDFVVTWTSFGQDGGSNGIYSRRYQADGTALDADDVLVNVFTSTSQQISDVAMDAAGNYVVVWRSGDQDGYNFGVYGRRYQADGTALDADDVLINVYTTYSQTEPAVDMDDAGNYVVTWQSQQDGSTYGIYKRSFQADGTALDAADVQINFITSGPQTHPDVAVDADGDYIVTWQSKGPDDDIWQLYSRRYGADGLPLDVGQEVLVNADTSITHRRPIVAMDADGDYIITWESYAQDGSSYTIYARSYTADGTAIDTEDRVVNTSTDGLRSRPTVAMDADGNYVIAWQSREQDGFDFGIFTQLYSTIIISTTPLEGGDNPIAAYPNPTSGSITVENAWREVSLYSLTGELVLHSTTTSDRATLDVSALPAGVYLLSSEAEGGEVRQVRIVVR